MRKACARGHKFSCGVRWEKEKAHKVSVQREREREGTMGSHQEESPNSCATTYPHTHVHTQTCTRVNISILLSLPLSHTHTHTHTDSVLLVMLSLARTSERLSRCWATVLNKGTAEKKRERETDLSQWWLVFILCSFKPLLINCF